MNITFKVARLGSAVKEFFEPNGDTTVENALDKAGYTDEGYDISVNGEVARANSPVRDGDTVYLVPRLKAGQ